MTMITRTIICDRCKVETTTPHQHSIAGYKLVTMTYSMPNHTTQEYHLCPQCVETLKIPPAIMLANAKDNGESTKDKLFKAICDIIEEANQNREV